MRGILVIAALAVLALGAAEYDEGVLVLTDANFKEEVAKYEHILVEFYAPWCGHCKKLAPEYAKAAQTLAKQNPPITIAKVDATENEKIAGEYDVKGFPTLKWITENGKSASEYDGGRTESEIINWINKRTGPASRALKTADELKEAKGKNKLTVAFFGTEEDAGFKTYENVARSLDRQAFFHLPCDDACKESLGAKGAKAVLFKPFDELQDNFEGELTQAALRSFITENSVPDLIEFSDEYVQDIFGASRNTAFLFADVNSEAYPAQKEAMAKIAKTKLYSLLYSVSDIKTGMQQRLAEFLGVKSADLPAVYVVEFGAKGIKKFRMAEGTIDEGGIRKFLAQYKDGEIQATLKSQEPPADPMDEGVKVIVGKNFEEEVLKADKDVFVKFYAPWCGHCKKLAPIWSEIGKELNASGSLTIAKFDATENEADGVDVQGFPTLIFYKKGSSKGVTYNGDREKDDLLDFIYDNASNPEELKKLAAGKTSDL